MAGMGWTVFLKSQTLEIPTAVCPYGTLALGLGRGTYLTSELGNDAWQSETMEI